MVSTFIDDRATINAGGSITIETLHNYDVLGQPLDRKAAATASASAGSLRGSGAGADAHAEASPTVLAYVDSAASLRAGPNSPITIRALANNVAEADASGIAVAGGLGVGAALADAKANGATTAYLDGNVTQGGDLIIEALSRHDADSDATAGAGGIVLAGAGADSDATAAPTSQSAYITTGRTVSVGGDVTVRSVSEVGADAESLGVSVAAGASVGVSLADAVTGGTIEASVGDQTQISADSLVVAAVRKLPSGSPSSHAKAVAGSGGLLLGVNATVANASSQGTVTAAAGDQVRLPNGDVTIVAMSETSQDVESTGIAVGIIGAGASVATAGSDVTTEATLGAGVITNTGRSGDLTIHAEGTDRNKAKAVAGSGGVVAGNASVATTSDTSKVAAGIEAGSATLSTGAATIDALHRSHYLAQSNSTNAAVLGASGASAAATSNTSADVDLGANVVIHASGPVAIAAQNGFFRTASDDATVSAAGGGGLTATAALSTTTLTGNSDVTIGSGAQIKLTSTPLSSAGITVVASSILAAEDRVNLQTGGAIQGAGVNASMTATLNNSVSTGSNTVLASTGNTGVGTFTTAVAGTAAEVNTWGLAAVGVAQASTAVTTNQSVAIGNNSTIEAFGNVDLTAGDDPAGSFDTVLTGSASAQGYVRGLIAVPVAEADTELVSNATLTIGTGTQVRGGQNATIAAGPGLLNPTADGAGHGFELGFIPVDVRDSDPTSATSSTLTHHGTVTAGAFHTLDITIPDARDSGGFFSSQINVQPGGAAFKSTFEPSFSPPAFIAQHYTGTEAEFLNSGTSSTPVGAFRLGALFASGGTATIEAGTILGSGTVTAYGGPRITLTNHSPDYLVLSSVTIPNVPGGKVLFTGAAQGSGLTINRVREDAAGLITIHNNFDCRSRSTT